MPIPRGSTPWPRQRPSEGRWTRSPSCGTSTLPMGRRTIAASASCCRGHDIVLLHGIHALAHAAAIDEGLAWATVIFDPVLLPTASAPPPGMPNLGPANRRGVVDARSGPGARQPAAGRRAGACRERAAWAPALQRDPPSSTSWPAHHQSSESRRTCRGEERMSPARGSTGRRPHPLDGPLQSFVEDGPPPIVMTFGSMRGVPPAELSATVDRVLGAGRRVIVQGSLADGDASPNLRRIDAVDHRALFPSAALVVHHGGAGTTLPRPPRASRRWWCPRSATSAIGPIGFTGSGSPHRPCRSRGFRARPWPSRSWVPRQTMGCARPPTTWRYACGSRLGSAPPSACSRRRKTEPPRPAWPSACGPAWEERPHVRRGPLDPDARLRDVRDDLRWQRDVPAHRASRHRLEGRPAIGEPCGEVVIGQAHDERLLVEPPAVMLPPMKAAG